MATASPSLPPCPVVLTYEDLCAMPEDGRRYEILEGELAVTPSPTVNHQRISRNLGFVLHRHVTKHELGEVLHAPVDVLLDRHTVVEPDLLFVSRERLDVLAERGVEGPPDLVVEVLSPSTASRDVGSKQQLYARYGVAHYWRIDPTGRSLTELVRQGNEYVTRSTLTAPATFVSALFPELVIELGAVFPRQG